MKILLALLLTTALSADAPKSYSLKITVHPAKAGKVAVKDTKPDPAKPSHP
jgi:hypothetical protein